MHQPQQARLVPGFQRVEGLGLVGIREYKHTCIWRV